MDIKYTLVGSRGFDALVLIFSLIRTEEEEILYDVVDCMMQAEFDNGLGLEAFDKSCLFSDNREFKEDVIFYLEFDGNKGVLEAHNPSDLSTLKQRAEEGKYWLP